MHIVVVFTGLIFCLTSPPVSYYRDGHSIYEGNMQSAIFLIKTESVCELWTNSVFYSCLYFSVNIVPFIKFHRFPVDTHLCWVATWRRNWRLIEIMYIHTCVHTGNAWCIRIVFTSNMNLKNSRVLVLRTQQTAFPVVPSYQNTSLKLLSVLF